MVMGTALISSGFVLFFANLHRRQTKKEEKDIDTPGSIPTCVLFDCSGINLLTQFSRAI